MSNILVIGGKGFIGSKFVEKIQGKENNVFTYDVQDREDINQYTHLLIKLLDKRIDEVWHFAAIADLNYMRQYPMRSMGVNVLGTINIANICSEKKIKLNFISTCCVYGNQEIHPSDEKQLPNPAEIYACSKLAGENIIKGYAKSYGLKYNILRIPTTYGPRMRPALGVYIFFAQALKGKPLTIHGNGKQVRTLTYIDDVVDALVAVQGRGIENETINISTTEVVSALDMAEKIKALSNSNSEIKHIDQRIGQTFYEEIDVSKAKKLLGWEAKTSFDEGLVKTYEWIKTKIKGQKK